jgi:hypothetical protein
VSYVVSLRTSETRLTDDRHLLLRLGTDADVDQTIRASLGHYVSYAPVLHDLGLPGAGALTLSVFLLEPGRPPSELRASPFQRVYRTTTVGRLGAAGVPIWATDITVEGWPVPSSADHFDLVVASAVDALPGAYAAADRAERRRLRDELRTFFEHVLRVFDPPQPFEGAEPAPSTLDPGGS